MLWIDLAWRNIRANTRRSLLIGGTVAMAVLALVLFAGYIKATRLGLEYATVRGGVGHFQITGQGGFDRYADTPLQFGLTPAMRARVEAAADADPTVRRTVPRLSFSGLLSSGARTLSVTANGIDPTAEATAFGRRQRIVAGATLGADQPDDAAVIGEELARRLGVRPGGYVTLLTTTVNGAINARDLRVVGLATTGNPQADLYLLQMKLQPAQELIATDRLSLIAVLLADDGDIGAAAAAMRRAAPSTETRDWRRLSPTYDQVVGLYESLFYTFGGFILAVTGFAVATAVLTGVMERTREIGLMRALGLSPVRVRAAFLLEAVMLSAIGALAGSALGWLAGRGIDAAGLTAPPPPGRTSGYPLRVLWDGAAAASVWIAVLILTAAASWAASARVARLRVVTAMGVR